MITLQTNVKVEGISGSDVFNFMLHCTDDAYQNWWPGVHLAFHTKRRFPNNIGNLVFFDEYVGKRHLSFEGVVVKNDPGRLIVWQLKKGLRLPAWLVLKFEDRGEGVLITHTLEAGFRKVGKLIDPLLRLYFSKEFENDLQEHAQIEFTRLAEILAH